MTAAAARNGQESWTEGQLAALEVVEAALPPPVVEGLVLEAEDIHVAFGGVRALQGASLRIPAVTIVGLIGPNGSGKSTLFDVINGFTVPDSGRVRAFGADITDRNPWHRARLGMCRTFQANHIDPNLTVFENLITGAFGSIGGGVFASVLQFPKPRRDQRQAAELTRAVARLMGLERVLDVRAGVLSFGGQRRAEIGRSIMSRPRLLLLDEPSAGMDSNEAGDLLRLVTRLQSDLGFGVCLIEHFVRIVFDNCAIVYALAEGKVIAEGTPDEVSSSKAAQEHYLGEQ
ncbi:MAG: ABC transporter ATP-binding protein [Acidimicrobiia bacterium]|nr:ABC transporter ATP-binding protein [Acidimicrobiia bacterium]